MIVASSAAGRLSRKLEMAIVVFFATFAVPILAAAQTTDSSRPSPSAGPQPTAQGSFGFVTSQEYNTRLAQLDKSLSGPQSGSAEDYRIGAGDLLSISVFGAPDMGATARVSASGTIYLPLIGAVEAGGLAPHELELVIEELLRRTYMKDPHVTVFVKEIDSHAVSVFGAVKKPGVFQLREPKTLIEVLSMAQGLADDAGDTVLVVHKPLEDASARPYSLGASASRRGHGPNAGAVTDSRLEGEPTAPPSADTESVSLKELLESGDAHFNVPVYPGDVVTVTRAGIVYVVGEVQKPGGFALKSNENISVLQAIALAQGLTHTSAGSQTRIIRTDTLTGKRTEVRVDLRKVLRGKAPDPMLQARDIVFVPNSSSRTAFYRGVEAAIAMGTGVVIYHP